MANDLEPYENITRVFWIRIELKEKQRIGRQNLGEIKDVKSGIRAPLYNVSDIVHFMIPFLDHMGIKIGWCWRLRHLLERTRRNRNLVFSNPTSDDKERRANS